MLIKKIDNTGTVRTMRGQPPPIRQTTVPVLSTFFDQRFQSTKTPVFRSSPGDDLVDWNSGVSVRPYVRPYVHKNFFSDLHLIWCVVRPRPDVRT